MAIQHYRLSEPTDLPVSVAEAKDDLELIGQSHDSKVTRHIAAARGIWERYTGRAAVPQSWVFIVESEAARDSYANLANSSAGGATQRESLVACRPVLELPAVPFSSIELVESKDCVEDAYAAASEDDYTIESLPNVGRVIWLPSAPLPPFRKITYTAGYEPGEMPAEYQETILKLVVFLFENRGDVESKLPTSLRSEMQGQSTGMRPGYWS